MAVELASVDAGHVKEGGRRVRRGQVAQLAAEELAEDAAQLAGNAARLFHRDLDEPASALR